MTNEFLSNQFSQAKPYDDYVLTGTPEQQLRWKGVYDVAALKDTQALMLAEFKRRMHVLVVSGIWCGDCVQQCPLMEKIAEANRTSVNLRFVDRDQHKELSDQLKVNAGRRVPIALFLAEDFELCSTFGDRSLSRYRAVARKQLGAACPTGIGAPDKDEMAATLGDWLDEFERIQLMLRLSPRLRQKHGD